MKKLFSLVFILIFSLVFSGCSGGSSSGSNKEKTGGEVTIWATNINVPVLKKAAEEYKKDHPDFQLNVVEMANDDIRSKVITGLQAGGQGLPDAALLVDDGIQGYLDKFEESFVNLSDKGFDDHAKDFPKYKLDSVTKDGKIYAMPFDAGPVGVFYRKDIFEKAGVDGTKIENWDDFLAAGKKIKEKTGAAMLSYDTNDSTVYTILLSQQGLGYFDQNGNTTLGSAESIKVSTLLQDLAKNDLLLGTPGWNAWVASLSEGKTATAIAGAWLIGTLQQQMPDLAGKWDVMMLPAFENGGSRYANQGGSSFAIFSQSKNIDETYKFLEYFTTNFEMQELAMEGGLFPSYLPVYESELFSKPVQYFNNQPVWKVFADAMDKIPSVQYSENDAVARDEVIKSQAEVVNGTDVKDSLEKAKNRVENRIK